MSERRGFITGGTWCVDVNVTVPAWPVEESSTRMHSSEPMGGGSSCNFAIDMRRLAPEIPVATVGLCGDDADGALLRGIARNEGIDISRFHVEPGLTTHRTMAFTARDNGRRTHIFEAASSDAMSPDHFDFAGCDAWMLHLGLPGTHELLDAPWQDDPSGWVTVLKKARAAGLRTNMELMTIERGALRAMLRPCLPYLDYLVVNDYEIGALAGTETVAGGRTDAAQVVAAARDVMAAGPMDLIAVHFPHGAVALDRDGAVHTHPSVAVPPGQVVGSNGAGDAFAAGFFCGLHRGRAPRDCLAYGHAAAAASLASLGTYTSVTAIETCLAAARRHGWRQELPVPDDSVASG